MSVAAIALPEAGRLRQIGLALGAVVLVAGAVALALWWLLPAAAVPSPARNPFGIGLREAGPSPTGLGSLLLAYQSRFFGMLRTALASVRDGDGGLALLLGIGFAYGAFHAAGPGHGKAIVSAYLVSSERALGRGLAISAAAALIQAGVAIGLVTLVFVLAGATAATMSRTANAVELAGFGFVVALGAVLVWRKAGKLDAALPGGRAPAHDPDCACGPADPGRDRSLGQMAAVALGAGIRPCAGAIVLLTLSRGYGIYAAGIAATLAMAAGTALTTGALATLAVFAKRSALRLASGRGRALPTAGAAAELAAAALVLVIGVALLMGVWEGAGQS